MTATLCNNVLYISLNVVYSLYLSDILVTLPDLSFDSGASFLSVLLTFLLFLLVWLGCQPVFPAR